MSITENKSDETVKMESAERESGLKKYNHESVFFKEEEEHKIDLKEGKCLVKVEEQKLMKVEEHEAGGNEHKRDQSDSSVAERATLKQQQKHKRKKVRKGKYLCEVCEFKVYHPVGFKHAIGAILVRYTCDQCSFTCSRPESLDKHKKTVHPSVFYPCDLCDFKASKLTILDAHKKEHALKVLNCEQKQCKFKTVTKNGLQQHKNRHQDVTFLCNDCDFTTNKMSKLKEHKRILHEGIRRYCDLCDFSAMHTSSVRRHKENYHQGLRYPCSQCDFLGKSRVNLRLHVKSKHDLVRYSCDQCDYKATQPTRLREHKESEHEGIVHYCDQCEYKAKTKGILKRHIDAKHLGVKYQCDVCDFETSARLSLNRHKRSIHDGVRYPCDLCDYKATQTGALKKHKASIHKVL